MGEKYLLPDFRLFLNLGGFSNLSYGEIAFDISPCNILLNHLYQQHPDRTTDYDPGGELARKGTIQKDLLDTLDRLPFYQQPPPKSLGWEWVEEVVLPVIRDVEYSLPDLLHTCTIHLVGQITKAVKLVGAEGNTLLTTGGGRHNTFLMERLEEELAMLNVPLDQTITQEIIDFKEAIIFAFLGLRTLTGRPTTLSSVTGAEYDVVTGSIHLPPRGGYSFFSVDS